MRRWSTQRKTNDSKSLPKLEKGLRKIYSEPCSLLHPTRRIPNVSKPSSFTSMYLTKLDVTDSKHDKKLQPGDLLIFKKYYGSHVVSNSQVIFGGHSSK